jgi:hypothetical protein
MNELTVVERAAVALQSDTAGKELAALVEQSKSIVTVTNKDGRTECHAAAMRAMTARTNIEKAGKAAREDAQKFSKAVIAEESRLIAIIEPEEKRLKALRDEWDDARAAEKAEAERIKRERIAAIVLRINEIKEAPARVALMPAAGIATYIQMLEAMDIGADFAEFLGDATDARIAALEKLREIHAAKVRADEEAEQARIALQEERERNRKEGERLRILEAEQRERDMEERRRLDAEKAELARQQKEIADQRAEQERREQAIRDEERRLAEQAKAEQEAAELAAFPEPTAQPAPTASSPRLDETVVAVAPVTGFVRLLDRLDELVRQMTDLELSDLCVHAAHILSERKEAA